MATLGDLVELQRGYDLPESERRPGSVPVIGSAGLTGFHDVARVQGPGVTLGRSGASFGKATYVREDFWPHNACLFVKDFKGNDVKFIAYLLESIDFSSMNSGSAQQSLNRNYLYGIGVARPSIAVQRRVVGLLSAYDDLIENCEQRIRVLDEMARTLYRDRIDGSKCTQIVAKKLIESGVLEIGDGYRAKNSELGEPGIPFARAGNVDAGFHFEDADRLHQENVPKAGTKISRTGDIVFTSKGTVGRFARVGARTASFVYSPQLCFWRVLKPEVLAPSLLFRWMESRSFLDQVDQVKGSTDMADYVSLTNQRRMMVSVPSCENQRELDLQLRPIDELLDGLVEQEDCLRKTRDLLLPRLLSGQLSVAEAA